MQKAGARNTPHSSLGIRGLCSLTGAGSNAIAAFERRMKKHEAVNKPTFPYNICSIAHFPRFEHPKDAQSLSEFFECLGQKML